MGELLRVEKVLTALLLGIATMEMLSAPKIQFDSFW